MKMKQRDQRKKNLGEYRDNWKPCSMAAQNLCSLRSSSQLLPTFKVGRTWTHSGVFESVLKIVCLDLAFLWNDCICEIGSLKYENYFNCMDSNNHSQTANRSFIFVIIVLCDNFATEKHPVSQRVCSAVAKTAIQGSSGRLPGSLMYRLHLVRLAGLAWFFFNQ